MTPPPEPQTPWRSIIVNGLIVALLAVLAPVIVVAVVWSQTGMAPQLFGNMPPQLPPPGTAEMVIVAPGAAISTANPYTGPLTLVVEGNITPDETGLTDLFYQHTDSMGLPLESPVPVTSLPLEVNGAVLDTPYPDYDPFHVYRVPFDAGAVSQSLSFRIVGQPRGGEFRVFVVVDG